MAQALRGLKIPSPGIFGINSQDESLDDAGWATIANNAVIDNTGRLAARKGWKAVTTSSIGTDIEALHEYLDGTGNSEIVSASDNKMYSGTTTLSAVTGTITTPTADDWKFQNFNGKMVGFQDSHLPVVYSGSAFSDISFTYPTSGTSTWGNECLAAFGRVWTFDATHTVLKYSDLLIENSFTDDAGGNGDGSGSAGIIDLKSVWVYGMDEAVGLVEFNGFLLIFGRRSIIVYQGPSDPATMSISDIITGVGCSHRDSIQNIGTDVLFLSDTGVRSLQRTIQEKSMPLTEISKNVRDKLLAFVGSETTTSVKSVYSQSEGLYILSLRNSSIDYVFDVRQRLEDGTFRATTWTDITPVSLLSAVDGTLYIGKTGVVAKYSGFLDDASTYEFSYFGPWLSMGTDRLKIVKRVHAIINGGYGYTITFQVGYDYRQSYRKFTVQIPANAGAAEYGIAEYGIAEYSSAALSQEIHRSLGGTAEAVQIGITGTINGTSLSFQNIKLFSKLGQIN